MRFGVQVVRMPEPTTGLQVLCLDRSDRYCIRSVSEAELPGLIASGLAAVCTEDRVSEGFRFVEVSE